MLSCGRTVSTNPRTLPITGVFGSREFPRFHGVPASVSICEFPTLTQPALFNNLTYVFTLAFYPPMDLESEANKHYYYFYHY